MLLFVGLFSAAFILIGVCFWLTSLKYRHYPGLGVPVIGDLYQALTTYTTSVDKFLKECDKEFEKFGDTFAKRFGPVVVIVTADPLFIEELSMHPLMMDKEPLIYNSFYPIFHGPFSKARSDKKWKHMRKSFISCMSKQHLEKYHEVFVRRSLELVDVLGKQAGVSFDLMPFIMLMSLDVIIESLAGVHYCLLKEKRFECYEDFKKIDEEMVKRILTFGWKMLDKKFMLKDLKNISKLLNEIFCSAVRNSKSRNCNSESEQDYIPLVENIVQELLKEGATHDHLMCHVTEAIMEAFYTSGVILGGALLFIGIHPEIQDKVWNEQREIASSPGRHPPTREELKRMEYLDRVVKEAVRLLSAPAFIRRSRGDIRIGNHFIPENSTVVYSFHRMRQDPRYWSTPKQFNPDHFLNQNVADRPKCAFLGFGVGIRSCPGYNYAMNFAKVVLSSIIRKFKIFSPLKEEDLEFTVSIFMSLKNPHTISIEPREYNDR